MNNNVLPVSVFVCLLAQYTLNHWMDFNGTITKYEHLQLFIFWSQHDVRWLAQLTDLRKHKSSYKLLLYSKLFSKKKKKNWYGNSCESSLARTLSSTRSHNILA